ncbi:MAG: hypothetical protein EPO68_04355 [Planctomycetota bacterium]|nr:MAG: hypothetical protein EPO68_04355 [Planctomycetota bacterium]
MSNPQDVNPYATPAKFAQLPPPDGGVRPIGPALPWEPMAALRFGWDAVLRQPLAVLAVIVSAAVGSALTFVGALANLALSRENPALGLTIYGCCFVLGLPLQLWMQVGLLRYFVKLARGQAPAFGEIFAGGPLWAYLGLTLLMGLALIFGFLLLIVPGVILALGWSAAQYLVADRRMGVIESLGASWRATNGHKVSILLLALLCFVALCVGMLALCIGYLVAIPVCMVAAAYAYLKITGEEPVLPPKFS